MNKLFELLNPIGFILKEKSLYGPEGIVIKIFSNTDKFCVKKYPNDNYSGNPLKWGTKVGLNFDETLIVLRQLILYVEW